jgi:tetratricopeptide (TPR) repeat protein
VREHLKAVCETARRLWSKPVLRQYTDHSVDHSKRMIRLIDSLAARLPSACKLTDNEAHVLLSAALLHDVGMQCETFYTKDFSGELFTEEELTLARDDKDACEEFMRTQHHLIGGEWVRHELGQECIRTAFIDDVADVIERHTRESLETLTDHPVEGEPMRLPLLAALLRLADELDLDRRRVDLRELEQANISDESKAHWWRCHYVESVDIDDLGRIKVTFRFSSEDPEQVQQVVPSLVVDGLRRKMEEDRIRRTLWDYGLQLDLDEPQILESAKGPSKTPIPERILRILASEHEGLARERFASESRTVTLPDTDQAEGERARPVTIPAARQSQQTMLQHARDLWAHGEPQEAVRTLQRATALYPESAALQTILGDLLLSRGQWSQAEAAARAALSSEPGGVLARITLGVALGRSGDHMKALEHLRIADLACQSIPVPARYGARVHMAIARSLAALNDYWYALERIDSARALFAPSGIEPGDQADRELATSATDTRRTAEAMILQAGSWEIAKPRLQGVLGRWAKRPIVRFESLTTLMEGILLAGSSSWVDYVFECEFQLVNLAAGFFVRADAWATTGLLLQIGPRNLRRHQMRHSNYFEQPVSEVDLPFLVKLDQWHRVRFEVSGGTVRTWIDDKPVDEWTEFLPLYASGKVGFRLWGREFTLYKNLRVIVTKKWVTQ